MVDVIGADGTVANSLIETINGYSYTPIAPVEAVRSVLGGERRPGFQTPAQLLGAGFSERIAGTRITDR